MISNVITSIEPILHRSMQYSFFYRRQVVTLLLALLTLALGVLIYLFDRPDNLIIFLQWIPFQINSSFSFGLIGEIFPSFAHTFAFILITSTLFTNNTKLIVFLWLLTECFFEAIQADIISSRLTNIMSLAKNDSTLIYMFRNYCVNGTFDWLDIFAIFIGASLAYLTIQYINQCKPKTATMH